MAEHVRPPAGSIITYFDPEPGDGGPFHRGVASGTTIPDPDTDHMWTVVTPEDPDAGPGERHPTALVDETLIVDVAPQAHARTTTGPHDPIAELRAALETAIGRLDELDEGAHRAWPTARRILVALLDTIAPGREALLDLLDDPDNRVALTIDHLDAAVTHLDAGRVASGRAALRSAHGTLTAIRPSGRLTTRPTRPGR
jgi:hypothetical protein